ncbi:hypothetical protein HanRHA438_Chr08g0332651 [Helianthus annuus]|uniref:Uncharacterized protein n=2 Tax=Helianthus annuus TaxID=4232 RepID=A0A9K3NB05_HELAN|nr:uncharacterized protein LOC110871867 isoform X1 [Helianthus annuus]XP_021976310.1 uncharacterized protein LOC110871867 isoform X1 [Helianthus annuus]XP_035832281.1 uncharacterized protein LOC110871867 isoform X1 [Helianthus annuus]KAF5793867.1 hypothetical protein HanXRQr2_Chr08g0321741 [Helianthus annuus]KAJ0537605.1 hypothetical protein HanHA300_Chr08g0265781 [Helianthus annuus]KAJ0545193.1 hypothetical protein HanIR_Chr08g0347281 [Helianthus annuus]KAJ0552186.1 hypothetical protein HanH
MGTEVHCKSSFEEYYSMRDVNEDSNSSNWRIFYGEKGLTNGHYYNGFTPRTVADADTEGDKDALKQKMLEHEAIFKNQVYELHRLYGRQRDMMEEFKRNEYHKHRISIDTSSSSSLLPSQKPYEDGQKWQIPNFPMVNSCATRPSIFGADISNSPISCSKDINNNNNSKDCEIMESRPSKVRKKLFDLELLPDDNVDHEDEESSYKDTSLGQCFRGSNGLADLNEPVNVDEPIAHGPVDGLGPSAKPNGSPFHGPTRELFEKSQNGAINPLLLDRKGNGRDWLSNTRETGNVQLTRVQDNSRFTPMPFPNSYTSTSYPYTNPTDLVNSWGKSNGSLTHKLTSYQKQPSFLSSPQSHVVFEDKWRMNMNGCYTPNGFYHGPSSGSRDPFTRLPYGGFDHRSSNNVDRSQKIVKGSNFIDLTDTTKGVDLNNDNKSSRKCDQTVLPWLHVKPDVNKNDSRCDDHRGNNGKILGFPVFGNSCVTRNDSSSLVSTSASLRCSRESGKIKTETENRGFDINVAWEDPANKQIDMGDDDILDKKPDTETDKVKNNFDLNSCLTEVEDVVIAECVKNSSDKPKKITLDIDLEAPAVPEDDEEEAIVDELLAKVAAEAIVEMTGISGQQDQVGSTSDVAVCSDDNDGLLWFVQVIENAGLVANEMDEFEELTLQQELTKEEDYMPKPLAPDFPEPDEAGPSSGPTRPRRGQARRGRPRRDFQRDILPGLVSLSRHEVTEDLQIFGGLMRATGHSWNVGPTRRNGTRGRRKSVAVVVEPPPPAASPPPPPPPPPLPPPTLSEERSLTGWGKTTRRPRRQRCAAGTSVAVPLT